jgi:predicted nuclease with TOPRIM domain
MAMKRAFKEYRKEFKEGLKQFKKQIQATDFSEKLKLSEKIGSIEEEFKKLKSTDGAFETKLRNLEDLYKNLRKFAR